MADRTSSTVTPTSIVLTTSIVTFLTGFGLGVYSIRGYLVPPSWREARKSTLTDPVESEESDIDEDDTILDHAPNWANGEEADRRDGLRVKDGKTRDKSSQQTPGHAPAVNGAAATEACKLMLVVRTDLGMSKGKIAAQCAHATLACYKTVSRMPPSSPEGQALAQWERQGQAKIAVQVTSEDELLKLRGKACSLGITAEIIQDAGRTQIDPGSRTVLGVGPAPNSVVDLVTKSLKLL